MDHQNFRFFFNSSSDPSNIVRKSNFYASSSKMPLGSLREPPKTSPNAFQEPSQGVQEAPKSPREAFPRPLQNGSETQPGLPNTEHRKSYNPPTFWLVLAVALQNPAKINTATLSKSALSWIHSWSPAGTSPVRLYRFFQFMPGIPPPACVPDQTAPCHLSS